MPKKSSESWFSLCIYGGYGGVVERLEVVKSSERFVVLKGGRRLALDTRYAVIRRTQLECLERREELLRLKREDLMNQLRAATAEHEAAGKAVAEEREISKESK